MHQQSTPQLRFVPTLNLSLKKQARLLELIRFVHSVAAPLSNKLVNECVVPASPTHIRNQGAPIHRIPLWWQCHVGMDACIEFKLATNVLSKSFFRRP